MSKVPVVILNGFLGSGKTTLFRSLLGQALKKKLSICAIVNDMSELDVDGELIAEAGIVEENENILESIHGCVISSKQGLEKLDVALNKLITSQNPELILIETTGSGHPMPLVEYFMVHPKAQLSGMFALVDSLMLAHDYNYGQTLVPIMQNNLAKGIRNTTNLLVEQILFCSHLILTKADRIEAGKEQEIASLIAQINPFASVHSVKFGKLQIDSLLELEEYNYHNVEQLITELKPILQSEKTDEPYNLTTQVIKDDRPFHPQRLWDVCHQYLDKRIYRSKGFFWLASRDKHSLLWNQAAGGINLEIIGSWRSGIVEDPNSGLPDWEIDELKKILANQTSPFGDRHCDLTVIGDKSQTAQFAEKLESCFLTDEEIKLWKAGHTFEDPWPKNIVKITY